MATEPSKPRGAVFRAAVRIAAGACAVGALAIVATALDTPTWRPVVLAQGIPLLVAISIGIVAVVALLMRDRAAVYAGTLAVLAAVATGVVGQATLASTPCSGDTAATVSVEAVNVNYGNAQYLELIGNALDREPDVLVLAEFAESMEPGTAELANQAGYGFTWTSTDGLSDAFRTAILTAPDVEVVASRPVPITDWNHALAVTVALGGEEVTVLGVHAVTPVGSIGQWAGSLAEISRATAQVAAGGEVIVAGDFNATANHSQYRDILADNALTEATASAWRLWGIASWSPQSLPVPVSAIDHILVSQGLGTISANATTAIGSDHEGVAATIGLCSGSTLTSSRRSSGTRHRWPAPSPSWR